MVISPYHPSFFFKMTQGIAFDESYSIYFLFHKIALRSFIGRSSHSESVEFEMALAILEKQISKRSKQAIVLTVPELYAGHFIFKRLLQNASASFAWQARNRLSVKHHVALAAQKIS